MRQRRRRVFDEGEGDRLALAQAKRPQEGELSGATLGLEGDDGNDGEDRVDGRGGECHDEPLPHRCHERRGAFSGELLMTRSDGPTDNGVIAARKSAPMLDGPRTNCTVGRWSAAPRTSATGARGASTKAVPRGTPGKTSRKPTTDRVIGRSPTPSRRTSPIDTGRQPFGSRLDTRTGIGRSSEALPGWAARRARTPGTARRQVIRPGPPRGRPGRRRSRRCARTARPPR